MENLDQDLVNNQTEYAGFWKRFAAMIIDGAIIMFVTASFKFMFLDDIMRQLTEDQESYRFYLDSENPLHEMIVKYSWILYMIILRWCYFAGMESSPLKATLGKLVVGIYVTDESGKRIDFARATGRHFAKIISGLLLGVGFLITAFNDKKQAMHDNIARCLVMSK